MTQEEFEKYVLEYHGMGINLYDKLPGENGKKLFNEETFKSFGDIDEKFFDNQISLSCVEGTSSDGNTLISISYDGEYFAVSVLKYKPEKDKRFFDAKEAFVEQKVFKVEKVVLKDKEGKKVEEVVIKAYNERSADVVAPNGATINNEVVSLINSSRPSENSYKAVIKNILNGAYKFKTSNGVLITEHGDVKIVEDGVGIQVDIQDIIDSVFKGNEDEYYNTIENGGLANSILEIANENGKPINACIKGIVNASVMGDN